LLNKFAKYWLKPEPEPESEPELFQVGAGTPINHYGSTTLVISASVKGRVGDEILDLTIMHCKKMMYSRVKIKKAFLRSPAFWVTDPHPGICFPIRQWNLSCLGSEKQKQTLS
jgi:hypothetical protein